MSEAVALHNVNRERTRYYSDPMFHRPMTFRNRRIRATGVCLFLLCSLAFAERPSEYQVKAVYLYNFGKFVNWPADAARSIDFDVCVLGTDPFGQLLDATVSDSTINGKRVVAKRIARAQDASDCRIVFIAGSESPRLAGHLPVLNRLHVLTVSDNPHFLERGGMIQFVFDGDRIRFAVNLTATQEAGLTLSSELLKVATKVIGNAPVR